MTDTMRAFLTEWLAWAEAGGGEHLFFSGGKGLCSCATSIGGPTLRRELKQMFFADDMDAMYPFGSSAYSKYRREGRLHEQPARLKWVREKLS